MAQYKQNEPGQQNSLNRLQALPSSLQLAVSTSCPLGASNAAMRVALGGVGIVEIPPWPAEPSGMVAAKATVMNVKKMADLFNCIAVRVLGGYEETNGRW